jgi:hypothetical protein
MAPDKNKSASASDVFPAPPCEISATLWMCSAE